MHDQQVTVCEVRNHGEKKKKTKKKFVHINAATSKQQIKRFDLE